MKKIIISLVFSLFALLWQNTLIAKTYIYRSDSIVVGKIKHLIIKKDENFETLARKYDMGYFELIEANPGVDPLRPKVGMEIVIPSQFVLPNVPHKGIVINLAEMRLYYFPQHSKKVVTFPVGIGKQEWDTPVGYMTIMEKIKSPHWYVPKSILAYRKSINKPLPNVVPPGKDNPLGDFAMRLSARNYLIHGTNDPNGVGRRSSAGCVRLYPEDIKQLFAMVPKGTKVRIINEPYKAGWSGGRLYLEAHLPLQEWSVKWGADKTPIIDTIKKMADRYTVKINWPNAVGYAAKHRGVPFVIGVQSSL